MSGDWIAVCKNGGNGTVKVVGPFDTDTAAHDWIAEHWHNKHTVRRLQSP